MRYGEVNSFVRLKMFVCEISRYLRSVETAWSDECVVTIDDIVLLENDMIFR